VQCRFPAPFLKKGNKIMYDKENAITAQKLLNGETCLVQGFGNSMTPILKSGQVCEVSPIEDYSSLNKGDIVLCKVRGHHYLHLISAIKGNQFQISNNHKHVNGWVTKKNIYGKVTKIL
jgi:phage repressor protein C with HTH and peptisase S24 domain